MIEKPNCLTCLNDDCPIHPNELPFPIEVRYEINIIRDHTKEMGCLSHSGAREYLMAPVIAELERQAKTCGSTEQQYALRDAIKLIRDGVEK